MNNEIRKRLPQFYKNLNGKTAIITNDIDSLMSFYFLKQKFDTIYINGFYNFNALYLSIPSQKDMFGIDLDSLELPTFSNHITHFYRNDSAVNLNNIFDIKYHQKFPLSTTMLILSLYDFDLESFSDEQLKIILSIDAGFKGYYTRNEFFKDIYLEWLDKLDIRFLEDRILKQMTSEEFYNIMRKYNLMGMITIKEKGFLNSNIDLGNISEVFNDEIDLPIYPFCKQEVYQYEVVNPNQQAIPDKEDIFQWLGPKKMF